ncbi:MAG TPA: hypothetical protein VGL77_13850 [Armatimonadota bacterium]|jgi:cation transport ATPase
MARESARTRTGIGIPPTPPSSSQTAQPSFGRRPASVTILAAFLIVISLYFTIGTAGTLIERIVSPQTVQSHTIWWTIGIVVMLVTSIPLFISALSLFRKRPWARLSTMILSAIDAICALLFISRSLFSSAITLHSLSSFDFGIVICLLIGCIPALVLNRPVVRTYFQPYECKM